MPRPQQLTFCIPYDDITPTGKLSEQETLWNNYYTHRQCHSNNSTNSWQDATIILTHCTLIRSLLVKIEILEII